MCYCCPKLKDFPEFLGSTVQLQLAHLKSAIYINLECSLSQWDNMYMVKFV